MEEENAQLGRNKQNKIISQSLESKKGLHSPNFFPRGTYSDLQVIWAKTIRGRTKLWLLRQRTSAVFKSASPFCGNRLSCKKWVQTANWIFHPHTRSLHGAIKEFPFCLLWVQILAVHRPVGSQPRPHVVSLRWSAWQSAFPIRCSLQPILYTLNGQTALQPWQELVNDLSPEHKLPPLPNNSALNNKALSKEILNEAL